MRHKSFHSSGISNGCIVLAKIAPTIKNIPNQKNLLFPIFFFFSLGGL